MHEIERDCLVGSTKELRLHLFADMCDCEFDFAVGMIRGMKCSVAILMVGLVCDSRILSRNFILYKTLNVVNTASYASLVVAGDFSRDAVS